MQRLLEFDLHDNKDIGAHRKGDAQALGLALARAGCGVEAARILRPLRKSWADHESADAGKAALEAVAWWNKNWRDMAQARQAGRHDDVLALVGDRHLVLWDQPALLLHLAAIAEARANHALARHLLRRVVYLSDRGLPKMDMRPFRYAAEASLVDVLMSEGDLSAAKKAYQALTPNPGNAMAHQIQGAELLALSRQDGEAMCALADILVTANTGRKGWSADIRREFVDRSERLARLRSRGDWPAMLSDPADYLKRCR